MRQMIVNITRKAAIPLAVWAVFLAVLVVWPDAPNPAATDAAYGVHAVSAAPAGDSRPVYMHTGLWVADMQADGTVVYLRQIKRR